MSVSGDYAKVLAALTAQGFDVKRTGSGHYRATPPDRTKPIVTFADSNPSERALKNALADLRRSGFVWPPPEGKNGGGSHAREICPACGQGTWDPSLGDCVNGDCAGSFNAGPEHEVVAEAKAAAGAFARLDREQASLDEVFAQVKRLREERELARLDFEDRRQELDRLNRALAAAADEHSKAAEAYDQAKKKLDELLGG